MVEREREREREGFVGALDISLLGGEGSGWVVKVVDSGEREREFQSFRGGLDILPLIGEISD